VPAKVTNTTLCPRSTDRVCLTSHFRQFGVTWWCVSASLNP
jgi:hypothetical protein